MHRVAVVLVALLAVACGSEPEAMNEPIRITGGVMSGVLSEGVRSFKGIPYAAPPVGPLRWQPPQAVVPWTDVRDGSAYGAECPQTPYPETSVYLRPAQPQAEDCLFLNVWTPASSAADRLPVLVWIHGGALTRGSSTSDVRSGIPLARKGIVLVSLNYRLGALGYLAHPELSAESPHGASGNYGLLDQIAALQWVQQNIAAFGGDPAQVTIAGESAGSWSVNALMASPLATGLFVRAIGQSGGRFGPGVFLKDRQQGLTSAEEAGVEFGRAVLGGTPDQALWALRSTPVDALLRPRLRVQETVDGWVLPSDIRTLFLEQRFNNVPVIVGSTADEATSLVGPDYVPTSVEAFERRIDADYGIAAASFADAYRVQGAADIRRVMLGAFRDAWFSLPMRTWARMATAARSRAYLYLFSHRPPSPRRDELGAFHASEIPYVFNVLTAGDVREAGFAYTDLDHELADRMSSYWVNFVRTGDPNGPGLPVWTPYNHATEPYLEFGEVIRSGGHLYKEELDFQEAFADLQQSQP